MKKKFIAVSVLICALALGSTTLTSCVDDNESASVTAIRDAKAAQLNALANYQQAQADAEKIISEAKAAIKNAEAKAKEIQNEIDSLKLEKKKATIATEIEAAQAKAEAELMKQQAALEAAKAALIRASEQTDIATQWKINNLMDYANAIMYGGNYILSTDGYNNVSANIDPSQSIAGTGGLQSQLITKKGELIGAKYNLEDGKITLTDLLNEENQKLAYNQALLAEYEKYNNSTKEDAKKALDEANAAKVAIDKTVEEATKLYNNESEKLNAAINKIDQTEIGQFIASISDIEENRELYNNYTEDDDTYDQVDPIKFTYDDGTAGILHRRYQVKKRVLKAEELAQAMEVADLNIEAAKKNVEEQEKAKEDALKATNETYKSLKEAVDVAQEAFDKNPQDVSIINGTGYNLKQAKEYLVNYEKNAESWVTSANSTLEEKEEAKKLLTDFQSLMTGDQYKTYETVYAEYIKVEDAVDTANVTKKKAEYNQSVQSNLIANLSQYLEDYIDWENEIKTTNEEINNNKETIEKLEAGLYSTNDQDSEAALEYAITAIEQEIATLETRIAQKQAQYENIMSQVEALINGEETPEVPETPEEGGEETPAE